MNRKGTMMMAGKLYGVGVGPGDPELMTLKAVRLIKECDFVAVPKSGEGEGVAKQIARRAVGEEIFDQKQLVEVAMPMTRDPQLLEESHRQAAEQIEALLDGDKTVVFLTLGDPAIYSIYMYTNGCSSTAMRWKWCRACLPSAQLLPSSTSALPKVRSRCTSSPLPIRAWRKA